MTHTAPCTARLSSRSGLSALRTIVAVASTIGFLACAAGAQARATVAPFAFTETLSDTASDDCRGGVPGTLTGTSTISGQFVDTYPPTQGFEYHGTESGNYRIAFVDGSTAIGTFTAHFHGGGPITPQQTSPYESTSTVLDTATILAPSGDLLGTETIHAVTHTTGQDLPPLGPSDNDTLSVTFDRMQLTCSV